ncbi:uncharacterized protein BJ212DRAFT_1478182 [Suillus subaureus]|uniref:Uncharacterized protein n=1 Tax=Suillus subaureus TaxID=48587 RepID=A0A9P7EHC6_9AGAM|nr:uncharacterized protein BJ212DRAFT_1478182 [Suillus subaureus]KAG1821086.1 hypothetical protein BJ212DRAFT_1478182 [Suillus subaureus]
MVPLFDQADVSIGITLQHSDYIFIAIACLWVYDFALTLDKDEFYNLDFPSSPAQLCLHLTHRNRTVLRRITLYVESLGGDGSQMADNMLQHCVVVTLTLSDSSSAVMQSPIPKVASCYNSKQSLIVIVAYVLLVITEIEILSFMLYHSWNDYREHGNDAPLVRVLVRHNIFYFACGLVSSTMAVVAVVALPASYADAVSEILATCMHRELYNTAHHTEETFTGNVSLPLVFAPALSEV